MQPHEEVKKETFFYSPFFSSILNYEGHPFQAAAPPPTSRLPQLPVSCKGDRCQRTDQRTGQQRRHSGFSERLHSWLGTEPQVSPRSGRFSYIRPSCLDSRRDAKNQWKSGCVWPAGDIAFKRTDLSFPQRTELGVMTVMLLKWLKLKDTRLSRGSFCAG